MESRVSSAVDPRLPRPPIRVLVVDDSAIVRKVLMTLLSSEPAFTVTAAMDPIHALEQMSCARPDVILLDLDMPRMDGLTFLRRIMASDPIPVIICSALTGTGTDAAFAALSAGAVDVIAKPKLAAGGMLEEVKATLVHALRAAARARLCLPVDSPSPGDHRTGRSTAPGKRALLMREKIIALGSSMGGPEALKRILSVMPADIPGIVIVQHMPEGFTAAFARFLNDSARVEVREAVDGDIVTPGRAIVAPANQHMMIRRSGGSYVVSLFNGPKVRWHRPSVDVLFRSVAHAAGRHGVGVVMTGMGDDGAEGLLEMRKSGAVTISQDEPTSAVFGMPEAAIARGAACQVVPLFDIPRAILEAAEV